MVILSNILYTYKNNEELKYVNDNERLKILFLETNFNYMSHDYIDMSIVVEHLIDYPFKKIFFQDIEDYFNDGCIPIINEKQASNALDIFPTIFSSIKKLSELIPELKNISSSNTIYECDLYYFEHNEKSSIFDYFDKMDIEYVNLYELSISDELYNFTFNKGIYVDISNFISNSDYKSLIRCINDIPYENLIFFCQLDDFDDEIVKLFKNILHISNKIENLNQNTDNINKIIDFDKNKFNDLENMFNEKLIGHNTFKIDLMSKLKHFRILNKLGLKKIFSIFILGSSGLGKTEVARILNRSLNKNTKLIKINFGNYSSKESLNSLIGSPRGYVGSENGELSIKLDKQHSGIILCDEFEKADSKIFNFFLELLEDGKFTDSQSREFDLNGYIIIFTSNLNKTRFLNSIPKEFQSRLDLISEFDLLSYDEKEKFVNITVDKINKIIQKNSEYNNIDLSDFDINFDLNKTNNLRDIQRMVYEQVGDMIISLEG